MTIGRWLKSLPTGCGRGFAIFVLLLSTLLSTQALAHGVAQGDKGYLKEIDGAHIMPFIYLGAKHMFTGYDHILFLLGVIFFLYRLKDIALYVSLFALGHSTTMLLGVLYGTSIDGHLIDAIIGLSVVYKAMDNIGAFQRWFGVQPNTKAATLIFGFSTALGWPPRSRSISSLAMAWSSTCSPSTSASRSANCWRWAPS